MRRPAGWSGAVGEYLTAMRAAGRSPGTVRLHRYKLAQFAEGHPSPWRVTRRDLTAWLAADHWQPETRKSARTIVRGFYRWAHGMGYLDVDPAAELPAVSVPPARPRPTPEHLVRQLIAADDERLGFMGMLAAFAGLRAGEIARVHGRDLIGDDLIVKGKGGTVGAIPILDPRLHRRLQEVGDEWAFPNGYGGHLSPGHVSKLLSRALPGDWTAHTLRHRCATQAYRGTRDIFAVKELLRHARLETTQRYTQMDDTGLRAAVAAAGLSIGLAGEPLPRGLPGGPGRRADLGPGVAEGVRAASAGDVGLVEDLVEGGELLDRLQVALRGAAGQRA